MAKANSEVMGSTSKETNVPLHMAVKNLYTKDIEPYIDTLKKQAFFLKIIQKIGYISILILLFLGFVCWPIGIIGNAIKEHHSIIVGLSNNLQAVGFLIGGIVVFILALCADNSRQSIPFDSIIHYSENYTKLVIIPLLKQFHYSITLDYNAEFPQGVYKKSKLFLRKYDKYYSSTFVTDRKDSNFALGYVHSSYYVPNRNGGSYVTIFSGLMARISCPKATSGQTFILPDGSEKLLGGFAKQLQGMTEHAGAKLITMDNPDFEKQFKVYTTDTVATHYLLSTKWLEELLQFQRRVKTPVALALHDSCCYVALGSYESPFTPGLDLQQELTATGVYTQYIRLKKLFDELAILQQIGNSLNND